MTIVCQWQHNNIALWKIQIHKDCISKTYNSEYVGTTGKLFSGLEYISRKYLKLEIE